jgi:hypothetical protein
MKRPDYILPSRVRYSRMLSPLEKLVYAEIAIYALPNLAVSILPFCKLTDKHLSQLVRCKQKDISEALSSLVKAGFIDIAYAKETGERGIFITSKALK